MPEASYQGKALSLWLELLRDHDEKQRHQALNAIRLIGSPAIPGLIRMFKDGHSPERYWAVRALGQLGSKAQVALPVIELALKDHSDEVRRAAREAYEGIDPKGAARQFGLLGRLFGWVPGFSRPKHAAAKPVRS